MGATPDPENKLSQEEERKYDGEEEVRSRVWDIIETGVLQRAEVYRALSCGGEVGCQPETCWIDIAIDLRDIDAVNLREVVHIPISGDTGDVVL